MSTKRSSRTKKHGSGGDEHNLGPCYRSRQGRLMRTTQDADPLPPRRPSHPDSIHTKPVQNAQISHAAGTLQDLTPKEAIRQDAKCDRAVALFGFLRGRNLRLGQRVHLAGAGDFAVAALEQFPDPCPLPETIKKRGLNEQERLVHAPMSNVGGLLYDKDATYIDIPDWKVQYSNMGKEVPEHLQEARPPHCLLLQMQTSRLRDTCCLSAVLPSRLCSQCCHELGRIRCSLAVCGAFDPDRRAACAVQPFRSRRLAPVRYRDFAGRGHGGTAATVCGGGRQAHGRRRRSALSRRRRHRAR